MKGKYVVEVINNCCFQHGTPEILERFSNIKDALTFTNGVKKMSIKETEKFNLWHRYITGIRILDTTSYPPKEVYEAHMIGYIPNYNELDVPRWVIE